MDKDQVVQRLSAYMSANLGMLPRTADMASKRYLKQYMEEVKKEEFMPEDLPDLGSWLAAKFLTLEIIEHSSVQKMMNDFREQNI